jgi:DNA polymerase III delta subunit
MIYLLYGTNFKESRKKLRSILDALLKKEPNASEFHINDENFSEELLQEMISSRTLFAGRYIVVLDKVLEEKERSEIVLSNLKDISESENIFIFIEEELGKTIVSRFEKQAEKIQEFKSKEDGMPEVKGFNVFSLTDALGRRDKKNLWVLYQKALMSGVEPEEMHGILLWQANAILSVKDESGLSSLKLNPFVLRKSLGFAKNFEKEEIVKLSRDLVDIYHEARRGEEDFGVSLEKFILRV